MGRVVVELPDYVVPKPQKGTRANGGRPYVLYYWQPNKRLRRAGFKPVALGRDINKLEGLAKPLNVRVEAWRRGEDDDAGLPPPVPGTIPHLIHVYQKSEDYLDKRPKTRQGYDRCLEILRQWSAKARHPLLATLTRKGLRELHKTLRWPQGEPCGREEGCPASRICLAGRNTPCPPEQLPNANAVMRVASILFGVGIDEGFITTNPGKALKLPGVDGRDQVWPDEVIDAFCATAIIKGRRSMALAVRMGADFGQREDDILKMHRGHRKGGVMRIIEIPILPELGRMLDETAKEATVYVISEETGRPYKADNFRHLFAEIRAEAGIDDIALRHGMEGGLLYMDLRRTAVVHLAYAGCTVPEIAAITGHSITRTEAILEVYLPRDSAMAASAIAKLDAWRRAKVSSNKA
jgi:hypothetical protein